MGLLSSAALLMMMAMHHVANGQNTSACDNSKRRILAFGDSLTEGMYVKEGGLIASFHPYANRLNSLLESNQIDVKVVESGKSGEVVEPHMQQRLKDELSGRAQARALLPPNRRNSLHEHDEAPAGQACRWDLVVIMGGINDLGRRHKPQRVFDGLMAMKDEALQTGAMVLMLTLLDTHVPADSEIDSNRIALNQMLRKQCRAPMNPSHPEVASHQRPAVFQCSAASFGFFLADVTPCLPFKTMDDAGRSRLWCDDGLHLQPSGYDKLADLVFSALQAAFGEKLEELKAAKGPARS